MQKKVDGAGWFGIDYNMNLYRGCSHGCIYCDSRSDCYRVENFDIVRAKHNGLAILERELQGRRLRGVVGIGAMSDSYNPFEKHYEITRNALKLLKKYGFGVSIETKSDLIVRDIDVFKEINRQQNVILKLTITAADDGLSRIIEPNVCASSARFRALRQLSENGLFTGILLSPILPYITDNEENIRNIIRLAWENGARFVWSMGGVTLRENQRTYFYEKLDTYFNGLKNKYIDTFGNSYVCHTQNKTLAMIFKEECKKCGLLYKMHDIIEGYKKEKDCLNFDFE
ncbi:MAG: radical SAM protein [Prevotellaceae bacterium]|nr:radical SAM protein [Prevotellaceae bacterium]